GQRELTVIALATLLQHHQLPVVLCDRAAELVFCRPEFALEILTRLDDLLPRVGDLLLVFGEPALYTPPPRILNRRPARRRCPASRYAPRRPRGRPLSFDRLLVDLLRQLLDPVLELADAGGQTRLPHRQVASLVVLSNSITYSAHRNQPRGDKWRALLN